jgi:alanyl-tRNA synthetase
VDFFAKKKEHTFVHSSPVVPYDDPTLLFTNAGMNQFKPIFLGQVDPKSEQAKLKRAVNYQKCIRAGGKHNDLDDVGKDTYHHTFFEMLGNWSFGDYFKAEAIGWAWELLTDVYGLDKERLYASYFAGNAAMGLEPDNEAKDIWLKYLPASRVLPYGMKENFWEMGETGPCGPCSEIHYDKIGGRDATKLVNADDPDVIEIWNNVFIQYNREQDGSLRPLPAKHVDTGMGLERLCSIVQKVPNNYDTDLFTPLFEAIQKATGFSQPYSGKVGKDDKDNYDMAYRVIADHARTLTFAINDGAIPSNEGRGYVLRRILRRAVRYGKQILGGKIGFFSTLVQIVIDKMSGPFPELKKNPNHIYNIIKTEEEMFGRTLEKGIVKFNQIAEKSANKQISAENVYLLYTTFGFPMDLTQIMAEEKGLRVDTAGFWALMEDQKKKNREDFKKGSNIRLVLDADAVDTLKNKMDVTPTEDEFKYELKEVEGKVKAIWYGNQFVEGISENSEGLIGIVVDRTNFYAEQGGQIHDSGTITVAGDNSPAFIVDNVQSFGGYVLHMGRVPENSSSNLSVGDSVVLRIDHERRRSVMSNHTSTHMVNHALRSVLGEGVEQKGSLVDHNRFRFDFSHNKAMQHKELADVDQLVEDMIKKELKVYTKVVPLAEAKKIKGLRAVFGETYPDPVRVVSVGQSVEDLLSHPENNEWVNFSIEFCGGTHITNSKEAVSFAIVGEEALAAGVRRITAVTGKEAIQALTDARILAERVTSAAKLSGKDLVAEVQAIRAAIDAATIPSSKRAALLNDLQVLQAKCMEFIKEGRGNMKDLGAQFASMTIQSLTEKPAPFVAAILDVGASNEIMSDALKAIRDKHKDTSVLVISADVEKKKVSVVAHVAPEHVEKGLKADEWCRKAAAAVGGKGGGKPQIAQGSGNDPSKVDEALKEAEKHARTIFP